MSTISITTERELSDRLLLSTIHALELASVFLGKELGLYATLADGRFMTSAELAARAGIAPRYAREWLEQQAVAGFLGVDQPELAAADRRYHLPPEHLAALVSPDDPSHLAPLAEMLAGIGGALPHVVEAYRSGDGVPYEAFGPAFRHGQAGINRPAFLGDLTRRWIPAAGDIHQRLLSASRPRIADIGCGLGWSTIAVARAYPHAEVVGYDSDEASVADARRNAGAAGVAVHFEVRDASSLSDEGRFDLALILESLHDMSRPVEVLESVRHRLAEHGAVIVAEENVADQFEAPGNELERLMYGWSIVHCLPVAMSEKPSAAIGTAIRAHTVRQLAAQAGFNRVETVPVDAGFFRIYRLDG